MNITSFERVISTVQGKTTDRRAVSITLSLYGARLTDCPLDRYYSTPAAYAQGQSAVRDKIEPDILFGPFALALEGKAFGSEVRFYSKQPPNLLRPAITSIDQLDSLVVPDIHNNPDLLYFQEAIRLLATEHGTELPIAAIALNPIDLPAMILSIEGWLEILLFDESGTRRILDITIPYFLKRVKNLLEAGATFIVMPTAFANPSIVTRDIVKNMAVPALKEAFSQVNCPLVVHSGGARLVPFLELFIELPNVVGFVVNESEDLQAARQKIGSDFTLIGNIEGPTLFKRSPMEISAQCNAVLQDRRDDTRFILGSSGGDVAYDTPLENIKVLFQAAEEFH